MPNAWRTAFENAGDTFIKIGMHLGMRLDFLPWTYSIELSRMRDVVEPFPTDEAIAIVERVTGRSINEAFSAFDPVPIGSNAVACTFQAITADDRKVVVKVRRPGIGERFMADAMAFGWLTMAVEFLTVRRPGYGEDLRREFRETLVSELDFVQEARSQDFFRRAAKKCEKNFFTAPRINFPLSGDEVIVEEFISGIWLWELLLAQEQDNHEVLNLAAELGIDPVLIAKRLNWVSSWSWEESMFFIANPHPDNIILGPKSKIIYTDFSQVSTIEGSKRYALSQNLFYTWREDALNMARASMILLEPLPPIDTIDFTKELETYNWQLLYMLASSNSGKNWAERTAALQWIGVIRTASAHGVHIDFSVLRLIRSILLSDTLSARLDPNFDLIKAYRRYDKHRARKARRRVTDTFLKYENAADEKIYIRLDQMLSTAQNLHFRLRHSLTIPSASFSAMLSKWSFTTVGTLKFISQAIAVAALFVAYFALDHFLEGGDLAPFEALWQQLLQNRLFYASIIILLIVNGRAILFRLDDKDI